MSTSHPLDDTADDWADDEIPLTEVFPSGFTAPCERCGGCSLGARELARLLRAADQEQLAMARMHEQAAERARVQAQQARDLLAGLVAEGRVSL